MRPRSCKKLANVRKLSPRPSAHSPDVFTDRVKRLKDARTEAADEIEAYRKDKEQEFSAFQSSVSPVLDHFCSVTYFTRPACWIHTGRPIRYR